MNGYAGQMIRLVIADDHAILRHGLRALLEQVGGYVVLAECGDADATREAVQRLRPDMLVLDISMPGGDGLHLAAHFCRSHPGMRILLYSQYSGPIYVAEVRRLGLAGFVSKQAVADELVDALASIARGEFYLSSDLHEQPDVPGFDALTDRSERYFCCLPKASCPSRRRWT